MGDPDPTPSSPAWGLSGCKKAVGGVPCHGSRSLGAGGGGTDRTSNKGAGPVHMAVTNLTEALFSGKWI